MEKNNKKQFDYYKKSLHIRQCLVLISLIKKGIRTIFDSCVNEIITNMNSGKNCHKRRFKGRSGVKNYK